MGIYYLAVDHHLKQKIEPPEGFANNCPGIFHPNNPFPNMVIMMNVYGNKFEIIHDVGSEYEYCCEYEDITEEVYKKYMEEFV